MPMLDIASITRSIPANAWFVSASYHSRIPKNRNAANDIRKVMTYGYLMVRRTDLAKNWGNEK